MIRLDKAIAKPRHRFLCMTLKAVTAQLPRDTQSGARPYQNIDFVNHTTLTSANHIKHLGEAGLLLFLDLKDTFGKGVLQFIGRLPSAPEGLSDLFHDLSIPPALLPAFEAFVEGAPAVGHQVDDDHLCALLRDAHSDMRAATKGSKRLAQPRTGTRPGAPAPDLTFNNTFDESPKTSSRT